MIIKKIKKHKKKIKKKQPFQNADINKLELESQKKIEYFKTLNEEANKKYLIAFRQYHNYMKGVNSLKQEIDKIATKKYDYDRILSHYTNILNEIDNPKEEKKEENEEEKTEQESKETPRDKKKMIKKNKRKMNKKKSKKKKKRKITKKEKKMKKKKI